MLRTMQEEDDEEDEKDEEPSDSRGPSSVGSVIPFLSPKKDCDPVRFPRLKLNVPVFFGEWVSGCFGHATCPWMILYFNGIWKDDKGRPILPPLKGLKGPRCETDILVVPASTLWMTSWWRGMRATRSLIFCKGGRLRMWCCSSRSTSAMVTWAPFASREDGTDRWTAGLIDFGGDLMIPPPHVSSTWIELC